MVNLKIAPPPANVNPAHVPLPQSGIKSVSKNATGDPAVDGAGDAQDFEAKLKQGLAAESKKEEVKKVASVLGTSIPTLQPVDAAKTTKILEKEKTPVVLVDGVISGVVEAKKKAEVQAELDTEVSILGAGAKTITAQIDPKIEIKASGKVSVPTEPNSKINPKAVAMSQVLKDEVQADVSRTIPKSAGTVTGAGSRLDLTQLQSLQGQAVQMSRTAPADKAIKAVQAGKTEFDTDFEIESLDVKSGIPGALGEVFTGIAPGAIEQRAASSKLSTSDYLNLRDLGKKEISILPQQSELGFGTALSSKKTKLDLLENRERNSAQASGVAMLHPNQSSFKTMDATVTQGAAGKNVLSHDSVQQLTTTVNMMSVAKQDGEIKIRLRPDHLGELAMTVKTQGNQVSIQIKAQDGEAKRIIEESLGSLKDSFAKQNLNLAQMDIVTAPNQTQTQDQGMQMNFADSRQNFGQESQGFDQRQNARQDARYEESFNSSNLNPGTTRNTRYSNNQGLDLIA